MLTSIQAKPLTSLFPIFILMGASILSVFEPLVFSLVVLSIFFINLLNQKSRKWALLGFLIFVPFQALFEECSQRYLPTHLMHIQRLDEFLMLVAICALLIQKSLQPNRNTVIGTRLDLPLFIFFTIGIISGWLNKNPIHVTLLGLQDMVRIFLLFYIFRAFRLSEKDIIDITKILFYILIVFCLFGLIEIFFTYPFLHEHFGMGTKAYRFGLRRITSFATNPNRLASFLYPFLIFQIFYQKNFYLKEFLIVLLGLCFVLTFSRQYWLGFTFAFVYLVFFFKSKINPVKIIRYISLVMVFMSILFMVNKFTQVKSHTYSLIPPTTTEYFRIYALSKSIEITKDHPVIGVGPGRFGGFVSRLFPSPIYEKYNFQWRSESASQIDLFWPQVWTETGLLGFFFFSWMLWRIYRLIRTMMKKSVYNNKAYFQALEYTLLSLLVCIIIVSFGTPTFSSLYSTAFFFALLGAMESLREKNHAVATLSSLK